MKNLLLFLTAVSISLIGFGQCQSNFSYSTSNGTVSFTNTSSGSNLGYSWSFGDGGNSNQMNPTHTYSNTGLYNVCLTIYSLDSLGTCQNTYCDSLYVVADSTGTNCTADAVFDVNPNGTITGTATSPMATSFYWSFFDSNGNLIHDASTNPASYNPGVPGVYTVCLTTYDSLQFLCDSVCYTVATDSTAGLNLLDENLISVYPNPVNDILIIESHSEIVNEITIVDLSGAIIYSEMVLEDKTKINMDQLPGGMYFVHALGKEGQQLSSCKVIKR